MTPYLYLNQNGNAPERSNGRRFWGYPSRPGGIRPRVIGVHTAESIFDRIGEDTGAEGVARYQASTARPSSYHRIVDRDSTVLCLPDEAVAFGIGGFNSATLHLSFALRAVDWSDPAKARDAQPMLRRAADVAREWCQAYGIPLRWLTKAEADGGLAGFLRHGTYDPTRRSDPGQDFPAEHFFDLIRGDAGDEDDMPLNDNDRAAFRADTHDIVMEVLRKEGVSGAADGVRTLLAQVAGIPGAVRAAVADLPEGSVDTDALAASIVVRLGQSAGAR